MRDAGSDGEIDVGHHALMQQQEIGRHARSRRRRTRPRRACRRRAAATLVTRTDRHLRLHLAQQRQALGEIRRQHEVAADAAARAASCGAAWCRGSPRSCRRRAGSAPRAARAAARCPASTVRPSGTQALRLQHRLRRARRHHARQRPAGDRERPLLRAGGDDDAPRLDQARLAARSRRRRSRSGSRLHTVAPLTIARRSPWPRRRALRPPNSPRPGSRGR